MRDFSLSLSIGVCVCGRGGNKHLLVKEDRPLECLFLRSNLCNHMNALDYQQYIIKMQTLIIHTLLIR